MSRRVTTARDLLRRITRDVPGTPGHIVAARHRKMLGSGTGSMFLWPLQALARKVSGKAKVNRAIYNKLHRPLLNIDQKTGKLLEREFGTKKLFRQVDVLPAGRKIKGQSALIKHERHSATAPVSKTVKAVAPLAAILYASQLMSKQGQEQAVVESNGKEVLLKEAAAALEWAGRRQTAEKLAFEMVERGNISPFQSYDQFHDKVAGLMEKDLDVVREAIEIDTPAADFGKLAEPSGASGDNPAANFYHTLVGE